MMKISNKDPKWEGNRANLMLSQNTIFFLRIHLALSLSKEQKNLNRLNKIGIKFQKILKPFKIWEEMKIKGRQHFSSKISKRRV